VGESGIDVSTEKVKRDLKEYIKRVEKGDDLDDMPSHHFNAEQQVVLAVMKNRINFLHHNYKMQKNVMALYESVIHKLTQANSVIPHQTFYLQGGGNMTGKNYSSINSQGVIQGEHLQQIENNIDQSIHIGKSFNEKKDQVQNVSRLMESVEKSMALPKKNKEEIKKNLSKVVNELQDEEQPDPSRIKKWLNIAKDFLGTASAGKELIDQAKDAFSSFKLPF
jgi:hypothetical protein